MIRVYVLLNPRRDLKPSRGLLSKDRFALAFGKGGVVVKFRDQKLFGEAVGPAHNKAGELRLRTKPEVQA